MKKTICFLLLLSLCCTLFTVNGIARDVKLNPPFRTESFDEYRQYVQETTFDYDFVSYEQLSYLGEFDGFLHQVDGSIPPLAYGFKISDERDFGIGIYYSRQSRLCQ